MDPGNGTGLLQLPTFTQMKLSLGMLNSAGRILFGFNGVTTMTLGDVTLRVKAGPVTQRVFFSVVEDLGPYNAIVGWTWLHSMKAVLSTPPNGELFDKCRAYRPFEQLAGYMEMLSTDPTRTKREVQFRTGSPRRSYAP